MQLKMIKCGSYKGTKDKMSIMMKQIIPTVSNWALHLDEKVWYDVQIVDDDSPDKIIIIDFEEFKLHNHDILVFCDYPRNKYIEVYRLNTDD